MKLYITDLDGTLLGLKPEVPLLTVDMLNELIDEGINITYATARSIVSARPILKDVNFKLPVITMNGAFITDPVTGENVVTHYFSDEKKEFLKQFFTENKLSLLTYSMIDDKQRVSYLKSNINSGVKRYINQRKDDKRLRPVDDFDSLFEGDLFYITLISPSLSKEELDKYFDNKNGFARNYQADTYDTDEYWYEIYRDDVSKANAIKELKALLGADEIICFGDNTNDISMFKNADRCYAVSNAKQELKDMATGVIRSNAQSGVPVFIAKENRIPFARPDTDLFSLPDDKRFKACLKKYSKGSIDNGIGTLNEKQIHSVLKSYFSENEDEKEISIGKYYADIVTENGIIEIQTHNFKKLLPKLRDFLRYSHVTVVYPYAKTTRLTYINKKTGEIISSGSKVHHKDMTEFFLELYRIKRFLNDSNLSICIAGLDVENYLYCGADKKRRKTDIKASVPVNLSFLYTLSCGGDYKVFIPSGLGEIFTMKEFKKCCKFCDASLLLNILKFVGLIDIAGKEGNAILYRLTDC